MKEEQKPKDQPSMEWLLHMADEEDRAQSVSVGGLAHDLGMKSPSQFEPWVFGTLIEFARRAARLTVEQLAERADTDLAELIDVERNKRLTVHMRTVYQLANALHLSPRKLAVLAGLVHENDENLGMAALRFAARSEPTANLSAEERRAFEEFVKVLVDKSE